jgi:hypothetical protein
MITSQILVKENIQVFSPLVFIIFITSERSNKLIGCPDFTGDNRRLDSISEGMSYDDFGSE